VVLTDVPGLYRNWPDTDSLISQIDVDELEALLPAAPGGGGAPVGRPW
jgi:acetylglutamate kinase